MKIRHITLSLLLLVVPAVAQPVFYSTNLPSTTGQYVRAYYSTNVNVAPLLALTNGGQYWDFSQPQQANETILRTDIVSPNDAGDGGSFPDATYAERDTMEPANQIAWRYYSLTNAGRLYYGFDAPVDDPVTPLAIFLQPTVDVPASVQLGQTWNRTVDWYNVVMGVYVVSNYFADSSTVDAYGILVLPSIGSVPALRVHEVHSYESYEVIQGSNPEPVDVNTNQYYYWLVPGLGIAAQVYLLGNNVLYPQNLPYTNEVLRVFESSYFTNQMVMTPVSGLHIGIQNNSALLNWNPMTNASEYWVKSLGLLNNTNWQSLGLPITNTWSDAVTVTQRFYRVFGIQ